MTDDELEQALFALPLEEPPAGLSARILTLTVDRPQVTFCAWEIWFVGTILGLMVWLAFLVATPVHDPGVAIAGAITRAVDSFAAILSPNALIWTVLGISFVVCVSQLSLPAPRRRIAGR